MLDNIENIEKILGFSNEVRIFFGSDSEKDKVVFRKNGWIIPIGEKNGEFVTYQNLTYNKKIGLDSLTDAEAEKYPYVVNPEIPLKIRHNDFLRMDIPEDKIKAILAYSSGKIALSKSEYRGGTVHDGYFVDKDKDALASITIHEKKKEAYEIVSSISTNNLEVFCMVAKLQKGANPEKYENLINDSLRVKALYDQIDENPDVILRLSEKNNSNFKDEIFIAFAERNNLIRRRNLDFYLEEDGVVTTPMGKTITQVVSFLRDNIRVRDNIMRHLSEKEEYYKERADLVLFGDLNADQIKDTIFNAITGGRIKAAFDPEKAKEHLDVLYKIEGKSDDYINLMSELLKGQTKVTISNIEKDSAIWTAQQLKGFNITINDKDMGAEIQTLLKIKEGEEQERLLSTLRERMKEAKIAKEQEKLQKEIDSLKE